MPPDYMTKRLPGRSDGGRLWVERNRIRCDGKKRYAKMRGAILRQSPASVRQLFKIINTVS